MDAVCRRDTVRPTRAPAVRSCDVMQRAWASSYRPRSAGWFSSSTSHEQGMDRDRQLDALELTFPRFGGRERVHDALVNVIAGEDLASPRRGLDARRRVHHRPDHGEILVGGADLADGRESGMDADPQADWSSASRHHGRGALRPPPLDVLRRKYRLVDVILAQDRKIENGHHRVTDEFV